MMKFTSDPSLRDILTPVRPGIHYLRETDPPDPWPTSLCGSEGAFGSREFVTCPLCLALLEATTLALETWFKR